MPFRAERFILRGEFFGRKCPGFALVRVSVCIARAGVILAPLLGNAKTYVFRDGCFGRARKAPPKRQGSLSSVSKGRLTFVANRYDTTGKIIPEFKLFFWERLLTLRYDDRHWTPHLFQQFPHLDAEKSVAEHRLAMAQDLGVVRRLRNRIAHHEPIFTRDLPQDLGMICGLIAARVVMRRLGCEPESVSHSYWLKGRSFDRI